MTGQLARSAGQGATAVHAGQRGAQVASSLQIVRRTMLDVFEAIDALKATSIARDFLDPQFDVPEQPDNEESRERWLTHLGRVREDQPSDADLDDLTARARAALHSPFDKAKSRMAVGLMLAAFPNGRPHDPEAYLETIAHEIEVTGYGPASVAKGCNTVARSAKFLPAAAEVLEQIEKATEILADFLRRVDKYKTKVAYADTLAAWMRDVEVFEQEKRNYTRAPERPLGVRTRRGGSYV